MRTWLFPVEQAKLLDNWDPIGLRGTASESYTVEDLFVPEEFTGTREDPTLRREPGPLYAFPQQTLYSVGIASVALGIARGMLDAFIELALRKTPRGTGRLADNAVIQAEVARAEARLGAARCYLIDTVTEIYRRAGPSAPIDVPDRARARLAGSNAITSAVAVADRTYKAAGVDAIFPGSPFERRFRDIHTFRSRSSRATPITKPSAKSSSATRPRCFCSIGESRVMCRNIKTLHNFKPPATEDEIRASSLQFVRKLSGFTRPSRTNQAAFDRAVDQVATAARELLDSLVTNAPPRSREVEASKARARSADRFRSDSRPNS